MSLPYLHALATWSLVVTLVGSVMAIGTVHVETLLVVGGIATVAAAAALLTQGSPRPVRPVWLLLAAAAFTLLQACALPSWLVERMAAPNAEVWLGLRSALQQSHPSTLSISLDPGSSLIDALRWWTYACVFLTACVVGARRGSGFGAQLVFASALALAIVTLAHGASDASRVFGVYTPRWGGRGFRVAPLINPNNLAGYLNLGTIAGLSLIAMTRPPLPRWLVATGLAPILGLTVLTGSRGGLIALLCGLALLLLLMRRANQSALVLQIDWRRLGAIAGAAVLVALTFTLAASGRRLAHLLLDSDFDKLRLTFKVWPMIAEYPWLGVGRGAFESVFPAFHVAPNNTVFSHPENFVLQWLSEWGVPFTLAFMGAGAWLLRPSVWGVGQSLPACGLFSGAVALLLHNFVDLSLEVPGVVIALCCAAGFAYGHANGAPRRQRGALAAAAACLLVGTLLAIGVFGTGRTTLTRDRDDTRAALPKEGASREERQQFENLLAAAMVRHPAEPFFPRLGGLAAWAEGKDPLPWLNRALERGPTIGRTHYMLGVYLGNAGRLPQAFLELRLAGMLDPPLIPRIAGRGVRLTQSPEMLRRLVPTGKEGGPMLAALARAVRAKDRALSNVFLDESLQRDAGIRTTRLTVAQWLVEAMEKNEAECSDDKRALCVERIDRALKPLLSASADVPEAEMLSAKSRMASGNPAEALRVLRGLCARLDQRLPCYRLWIQAASRAKDVTALKEVSDLAGLEGCPQAAQCAALYWALGEAAENSGAVASALQNFERAATYDDTVARWRQVARAAHKAGDHGRGLRALERAQLLVPNDAQLKQEVERARLKILLH